VGRKSNRKWLRRILRYRRARIMERIDLLKLFGRHRKFNP